MLHMAFTICFSGNVSRLNRSYSFKNGNQTTTSPLDVFPCCHLGGLKTETCRKYKRSGSHHLYLVYFGHSLEYKSCPQTSVHLQPFLY
ncbi:hypothetical protein CW304_20530 [Bacillus sp. UFRGS-B20]|nr:hypothetical protein CW304_20530 [Bacillus sp. UFRGS-B20]